MNLIPLRIDVSHNDVRLIDTILFDPTCWPIPLRQSLSTNTNTTTTTTLEQPTQSYYHDHRTDSSLFVQVHELVECNVRYLAQSIVSDVEVYSMGRTVRHFTNRIDTTSFHKSDLQRMVEQQLRSQLWNVVMSTTLCPNNNVGFGSSSSANDDDNNKYSNTSSLSLSSMNEKKSNMNSTTMKQIQLRLCTHNGIVIYDDIQWDVTNSNKYVCPIDFAQRLVNDLHLSDDVIPAIVTSLVEQLYDIGRTNDESLQTNKKPTSAFVLDNREQLANISYVSSLHRPTTS